MAEAQGRISADWLFPLGASAALTAAIEGRFDRDRQLLTQIAGVHTAFAALDEALDVRPELWRGVPGAAGVRLADGALPARINRVATAAAGAVAEVACAAKISAVLTVGPTAAVSFPSSRLIVRFDSVTEATITIDHETVTVQADGVWTVLTARTCGEVGLEAPENAAGVERIPALDDFLIDVDGVSSVITLPPHFALLGRSPHGPESTQLRQALAVLARTNPELHAELRALPVRFALLDRGQHRLSLTATGLPDVIYTNLVDPLETVDLIVHEYHHLKLDLLAETVPLLENPAAPVIAPWRPDIRTADGVLHGAYVFANVARAFDPIMALGRPSAQGRRRRAAWRAAVLRAVELLRESDARPTEAGQQLLDGMAAAARAWIDEHAEVDQHELRWATAEVERHVREVALGTRPEPRHMIGVLAGHHEN
ncbi:aKG-HExxH-type peptide beta-hydroxylase [Micromonospora sp. NPDC049048]|uniref:aKG-HExxH-type peptide beta-hydroxylase n=1 Tax=Micromonospora sp. NPDC049048 TaxID=3364263 RepID=UPI0037110EF6